MKETSDIEINDVAITFDTDWAPDFAIDKTAEILIANNTKATWFITHDSKAIRKLFDHADLFELGIHPNFMPGSTHGTNYQEVIANVLKLVPNAKVVRTHAMFYSAPLSRMFAFDFGLETDSSMFLAGMPHIIPQEIIYDNRSLIRMPYLWSDDAEMSITKSPSFEFNNRKFNKPGLKILDFHPIHVFINSENMNNYNALKQKVSLRDCKPEEVKPFINKKNGSGSLLEQIIKANPNPAGFKTLTEIASDWKLLQRNIQE
jgi:hypothetical protein